MTEKCAAPRWYQDLGAPVLAVCGYSGSGKTTLLERVIPHLVSRGFSIAVVKHDAHGVIVDTPGKDSDRLFHAGATVALRGPDQQFHRRGHGAALSLQATLAFLSSDHDLLLVEGHKDTPLPKVWLEDAAGHNIPEEVCNVLLKLAWNSDRLESLLKFLDGWIHDAWIQRSLYRGIVIDTENSRIGSSKQLLELEQRRCGELVASALCVGSNSNQPVLLGTGAAPMSMINCLRLPGVNGIEGPCAALLAGHRWAPGSCWLVADCDHLWITSEHISWLISFRRPGTWAVIARQEDGHPCPTFALYEPQALTILERGVLESTANDVSVASLINHPRTLIAEPPRDLAKGFRRMNPPEELSAAVFASEMDHRPKDLQ